MQTIFLAYAFGEADQVLAAQVERLLASHNVRAVTGKSLGGEVLAPAVQRRIQNADGLIALLTRSEQTVSGGWTTHDWVRDEFSYAHGLNKPTIALVEDGVIFAGAYTQNEFVRLDRGNMAEALLGLSETFGEWKRRMGRSLKVQVLPNELAFNLAEASGVTCRYRFVDGGTPYEWQPAELIPETGGAFLYLRGVQDNYLVQIEIERADRRTWVSVATSQYLPVSLRPRE